MIILCGIEVYALALRLIREGNYGACIDCGDAIGYERLSAYPTAGRCIRCQERHETASPGGVPPKL